jgi:sugar phosphate isomerase/epimerase
VETQLYDDLLNDLLELKAKYNLTYRCHNYFPPPPKSFVLNLASLDDDIFQMSMDHAKKALELSESLGADKYGLHAGF